MTYFVDFVNNFMRRNKNNLIRKNNIPIYIYLILNIFVIYILFGLAFSTSNFIIVFLFSLGIYVVSLVIAISPFGEWILRLHSGCRKIKRKDQIDYIEPIFKEVLKQARELDPHISEDVKLYIRNTQDVNAFAIGRKTICITDGLLKAPVEQIKATIAHEMGHIAHRDTDWILVISVGNFIVTFVYIIVRVFGKMMSTFFELLPSSDNLTDGGVKVAGMVQSYITDAIIIALMWAWTKIGILLVMKSNRDNEFEADKFAFNLSYGNALCELLDSSTESSTKGLFANLMSSHPDKNDRIAALMNLGATYRRSYGAIN